MCREIVLHSFLKISGFFISNSGIADKKMFKISVYLQDENSYVHEILSPYEIT